MRLHVHLDLDSTGETVTTVARAAVSQFEDVVPVEHVWFFISTRPSSTRCWRSSRPCRGWSSSPWPRPSCATPCRSAAAP
ncbi:MAG: hypothetical protein U1E17_01130 [Geminicoccaceae bacterium]